MQKGVWNASAGYGYYSTLANYFNDPVKNPLPVPTEKEIREREHRKVEERYKRRQFASLMRQFEAEGYFVVPDENGEYEFEVTNLPGSVTVHFCSWVHTNKKQPHSVSLPACIPRFGTVREFEKLINNKANWISPTIKKPRKYTPIDRNLYLAAAK